MGQCDLVSPVRHAAAWLMGCRDVLLACKSQQPPSLPPPSPVVSFNHLSQPPDSSLASFPFPVVTQHRSELSDFKARIASLRARAASSVAPPIQKVGDTWVAASVLGTTDVALNGHNKDNALRQSVQRMFDTGPDDKEVLRRESEATERIQAWQPSTERELSIFSRSKTKRSSGTAEPISIAPYGDEDRAMVIPQSETVLSFDPNDLNPSRSASQVRRPSAVVGSNDQPRPYASRALMTVVMEGESDNGDEERNIAPTLLSHVTFPKPTLKGMPMMIPGGLPMVPSISSSSVETGKSSLVQTPQTEQSSLTTVSSADPAVLAKLESHSTEHGGMASQIDGVQVDIHRIISSLGALVQQAKVTPNSFPKALDDRISSLQLDVKGVENALQLSSLASNRQPQAEEPKLVEVHTKLDNIAKLCEDLLGKQAAISSTPAVPAIDGLPIRAAKAAGDTSNSPGQPESQGLAVKPSDEKIAGEEVAQIMADLVGAIRTADSGYC